MKLELMFLWAEEMNYDPTGGSRYNLHWLRILAVGIIICMQCCQRSSVWMGWSDL